MSTGNASRSTPPAALRPFGTPAYRSVSGRTDGRMDGGVGQVRASSWSQMQRRRRGRHKRGPAVPDHRRPRAVTHFQPLPVNACRYLPRGRGAPALIVDRSSLYCLLFHTLIAPLSAAVTANQSLAPDVAPLVCIDATRATVQQTQLLVS